MKKTTCLTERDLTLLYYQETPESMAQEDALEHLEQCGACRKRQRQLERCLHHLPQVDAELGPHHATRLAARVVDRLPRRRSLLPAVASVLTAAMVVFAVASWKPEPQVVHNSSLPQQASVQQETPPVDLLENLELLREFETLSEITGV